MGEAGYAGFDVHMLGGFSIIYKGNEIVLGRKSTLKFIQMLQLVWLHTANGIRKDRLIDALYSWSDVTDANNSVNNLLHQVRKNMAAAGVPRGEYIILSEGIYSVDPQFPVKTDVQTFEETADRGLSLTDEAEKEDCLRSALELYQGEMLPAISTEIWVIEKNLQLKRIFEACMEWLTQYYWKTEDYESLEAIYERAVRIYPDDTWQIGQIDVLLEKGESKKAFRIYKKMVKEYSERMGLPPTPEMLACYNRINQTPRDLPGSIEEIQRDLEERIEQTFGRAYCCSYQSFVDLCHVVRRSMERQGNSVYLMLCTLVDYEGKNIRNKKKLQERSLILEEVIAGCLRASDAFTRYNQSQYLILLVGINWENCDLVYRRIKSRLQERIGSRAMISYEVSSLADFLNQRP